MKNNNYKFSVLMSVYYKEKPEYLEQAINSVIDQTLAPNEIVIVKDGPLTLELDKVIDNYLLKYKNLFKIVTLEKNCGLGIALNKGLKACSNNLIARMDTDDIAIKNRFEKQINIFKAKDVDLVGGNIIEFDGNMENIIAYKHVPENDYEIKKYAKKRNPFNHMSVMFKKSSVELSGEYQDCPLFEDYYLWVRMIKNNCNFYNIQDYVMNVRGGLDMIKRRGGIKYIKFIVNFNKKIYQLKYINTFELIRNVFIRSTISIIPNKIRKIFYQKHLRKEV